MLRTFVTEGEGARDVQPVLVHALSRNAWSQITLAKVVNASSEIVQVRIFRMSIPSIKV